MKRIAVMILLLLIATAAAAQRPTWTASGSVVYATVSGDDFQGTNAGLGIQVEVRRYWPEWSLGVGAQYTSHDATGFSDRIGIGGFFVEPRYTFPTPTPNLQPYVAGRAMLLYERLESGADRAEASGTAFGVGKRSFRVAGISPWHGVDYGIVEGISDFDLFRLIDPTTSDKILG